jgi:hypothetical protein
MKKNVLLSNARGNFSVELSPDDARNVLETQRRMAKGPFQSEELNRRLEQLQIEAAEEWSKLIIGAVCIFSLTCLTFAVLSGLGML